MSPHGHISTIYRAMFTVPEDVYEYMRTSAERLWEYEQVSLHASSLLGRSGHSESNSYGPGCTEIGESLNRQAAENFIIHWHNWVLQWQERMRQRKDTP